MPSATNLENCVAFGQFRLNLQTRELSKRGLKLRLSGQAAQALVVLVTRPGELVTRENLRDALWPEETFVDFDHGLNNSVNRIRDVLGDSSATRRFIETLPKQGYRFIANVEPSEIKADVPRHTSHHLPWIRLFFMVIPCAIALMFWRVHSVQSWANLIEIPLTTLSGQEISPSLSPDGNRVAFAWNGETNGAGYDLYVQTVGAEKPLRLTRHQARYWLSTAWSPDGRFIATQSADPDDSAIMVIPATGGAERKLTATANSVYPTKLLSWAPDSKSIAYVDHICDSSTDRMGLFLLSPDTLQSKRIETSCPRTVLPAFGARTDTLAFACIVRYDHWTINTVHLTDSKTSVLLDEPGDLGGLDWSPDGKYLYYSHSTPGGDYLLWRLEAEHPQHRAKLSIGHDAFDLSVSHTGDTIAYAQSMTNVNIWRLDLTSSPVAHKLITSSRTQNNPNISPDGAKIAFESDRTGSRELWVSDADGTNPLQISSLQSLTSTPRWSPDSKRIVFDSRVGGSASIYIYDTRGGPIHKLATSTGNNSLPAWSADGRWIYYSSGTEGESPSIWRVSAEGGQATKLIGNAEMAVPSLDGKYIYFRRPANGVVNLMRVRIDGTSIETLETISASLVTGWWPSSKGVFLLTVQNGAEEITYLNPTTKERKRIFTLEKPSMPWVGGLAVSPDQKWLLFTQVDDKSGDLFLVRGIPPH